MPESIEIELKGSGGKRAGGTRETLILYGMNFLGVMELFG